MRHSTRIPLLLTLLQLLACRTEIPHKEAKLAWLDESVIPIVSIDPTAPPPGELAWLESTLDGVEIVALGEQGHGCGSTFLAKTRLIKYLHEECGFDVLVFEAGLLDCRRSWREISSGKDPHEAFRRGIFEIWADCVQVADLIDYLGEQAQGPHPLELAGFDIQMTGTTLFRERLDELNAFLTDCLPDYRAEDYPVFQEIMLMGDERNRGNKPDEERQQALFTELTRLQELVAANTPTATDDLIRERALDNIGSILEFFWKIDFNDIEAEVGNIRDREMGANLIWLKETLYPDRKLILWAANSHLFANRDQLRYPDEMIPMGQYLRDRYAERLYVVGITSLTGERGSLHGGPYHIGQASNKSIEYLLGETGCDLGFIDFRTLPCGTWLDDGFTARFLGHSNRRGRWTEMMDGMLYIREMEPRRGRDLPDKEEE